MRSEKRIALLGGSIPRELREPLIGKLEAFGLSALPVSGAEDLNRYRDRLALTEVLISVVSPEGSLLSADLSDWSRSIDRGIHEPLLLAREVLPHLIRRGHGHLFHVTLAQSSDSSGSPTRSAIGAIGEIIGQDLLGANVKNTWIDARLSSRRGLQPEECEDLCEALMWCLKQPSQAKIQEIRLSGRR